jgi:phage-related protein
MKNGEKRVPAVFYRTASGNEPVRDWLKDLDREDRRTIGFDLKTVEFAWPIGMPLCRPLGHGLWEMRSNLRRRRISRVIFCLA